MYEQFNPTFFLPKWKKFPLKQVLQLTPHYNKTMQTIIQCCAKTCQSDPLIKKNLSGNAGSLWAIERKKTDTL